RMSKASERVNRFSAARAAPDSGSFDAVDSGRREFLVRSCQGASAALIPAGLRHLGFAFSPRFFSTAPLPRAAFHPHPHYRAQAPLDAVLLNTQAGLDVFITEKYADQI